MKKLLFTTLLLCFGSIAFSQYTFTGTVVDDEGEPIAGATIHEKGTNNSTISNINGEFIIKSDEPEISIELSYVGFSTSRFDLSQINDSGNIFALSYDYDAIDDLVSSGPYGGTSLEIAPVFVSEKYPVTQSTVTAEDLNSINLAQDIPILLDQLPSVVTTSDAGAGVGYTGIRVRGSDATRVNVTINGIPLNDSESQGVFWVNTPDFSSSLGKATVLVHLALHYI